jgi:hypothetical protein
MRLLIGAIALVSGAALAHGDHRARDIAAQTQDRAQVNPATRQKAETRQDAAEAKLPDERERFCIRNHLGRVNCVVYPGSGGH